MRFPDLVMMIICLIAVIPLVAIVNPFNSVMLPNLKLPEPPIPEKYPQTNTLQNVIGDFYYALNLAYTYFTSVFGLLPSLLGFLGATPEAIYLAVTVGGALFAIFIAYVISGRSMEHTQR